MRGYIRQDGQVGIRNTIQVIFMVECASHVAKKIAESFDRLDVQHFGFSGCYPSDYGYRLVKNLATHSNVAGVLIISLGCENFDRDRLAEDILASGRPCHKLVIQEAGGTSSTIAKGKQLVESMLAQASLVPTREIQFSDLIVGTICGGSDGTSGITGNPAVGRAFDRLIASGSTCIFEESGELIGCEPHMMQRAASQKARDDIDRAMDKAQRYYATMGLGSFSNGNAVGGLTTQEEKSLGAYTKSGDSPISGVILPTEIPKQPGLYLMDVVPDGEPRFGYPNINDTSEIIELIATGCHLVLFTTGRGSVVGSVISPVIKVCNNPQTWQNMHEDMDINAGKIISENATLDEVAEDILQLISQIASGSETKSESLGHSEFVLTYKAFDYEKGGCRIA
ncbi:UxaA family hydrolase [Buttiauxella noackiae]|uniref:UxaA family hydrolase n=1 Tax=Buttiauxella noackiae TaxID=82992 RepID=UPI0035A57B5C